MSATTSADPASLEGALRTIGIRCRVEGHARLALLSLDAESAATLADEAIRRRVVALLPAHGFTHVALELEDDAGVPP